MKTIYAIALSFAFCSICRSQTDFRFADSTAQWNIVVTNNYGSPTFTYHTGTLGDTIINNKPYQHFPGYISLLRRDSLKIYSWQDSLIYDFGAQAGDTVKTYTHNGYYDYTITDVVQAVDTVNWGRLRRRLTFTSGAVWVDGVGNLRSFPFDNCFGIQDQLEYTHYNVLCFYENGQLLYHSPDYATCDYNEPNGINEYAEQLKPVKLYPNPADDRVTFELPEAVNLHQAKMELTDLNGKLVNSFSLSSTSFQLTTRNLSAGMYFYKITLPGKRISSGKLLVQH